MLVENLISAMQNAQTVAVMFKGTPHKEYTYKVPTNWEVKEGDTLVVDSPLEGLVTVAVTKVHESSDIDLTAKFTYKWAVAKVDRAAYNEKVAAEKQHAKTLKELQRKADIKRQLASLITDLGDEARAFLESIK